MSSAAGGKDANDTSSTSATPAETSGSTTANGKESSAPPAGAPPAGAVPTQNGETPQESNPTKTLKELMGIGKAAPPESARTSQQQVDSLQTPPKKPEQQTPSVQANTPSTQRSPEASPAPPPQYRIASASFTATGENTINVVSGSKVQVIDEHNSGWTYVRILELPPRIDPAFANAVSVHDAGWIPSWSLEQTDPQDAHSLASQQQALAASTRTQQRVSEPRVQYVDPRTIADHSKTAADPYAQHAAAAAQQAAMDPRSLAAAQHAALDPYGQAHYDPNVLPSNGHHPYSYGQPFAGGIPAASSHHPYRDPERAAIQAQQARERELRERELRQRPVVSGGKDGPSASSGKQVQDVMVYFEIDFVLRHIF